MAVVSQELFNPFDTPKLPAECQGERMEKNISIGFLTYGRISNLCRAPL
jgi:hypothetical protein